MNPYDPPAESGRPVKPIASLVRAGRQRIGVLVTNFLVAVGVVIVAATLVSSGALLIDWAVEAWKTLVR